MINKVAAAIRNKPSAANITRRLESSSVRSKRKMRELRTGLLYAFPALFLLLLFRYWPLVFGMWISLWKWGYVPEQFVGLDNYVRIFRDEIIVNDSVFGLQPGAVGQGLLVTIFYAIGTIPISLLISFFVAYVLFHITRGKTLLRILFFLPYITSQVAAAIVFKWIFHPSVGLANSTVTSLGGTSQQWLTDPIPVLIKLIESLGGQWPASIPTALAGPTWALSVIILFAVWGGIGFQIIVFMSGMTQIPNDLNEAARIDGARTWNIIRHVTLPLLSPTWFLLLIVSIIGAFESFNAFYVFSGGEGGPLGSTMSLPLYIFRSFYVYGQVGYASALSMFLFVILLVLTWLQIRFGEKKVYYMH